MIGADSYLGYCLAVSAALVLTARTGPRVMAVAGALVAVAGMAIVAAAPGAWVLGGGILIAGAGGALASPALGDAVATVVRIEDRHRANALINSGTSVGVVVSAPAALLAAGEWRVAWGSSRWSASLCGSGTQRGYHAQAAPAARGPFRECRSGS